MQQSRGQTEHISANFPILLVTINLEASSPRGMWLLPGRTAHRMRVNSSQMCIFSRYETRAPCNGCYGFPQDTLVRNIEVSDSGE